MFKAVLYESVSNVKVRVSVEGQETCDYTGIFIIFYYFLTKAAENVPRISPLGFRLPWDFHPYEETLFPLFTLIIMVSKSTG